MSFSLPPPPKRPTRIEHQPADVACVELEALTGKSGHMKLRGRVAQSDGFSDVLVEGVDDDHCRQLGRQTIGARSPVEAGSEIQVSGDVRSRIGRVAVEVESGVIATTNPPDRHGCV